MADARNSILNAKTALGIELGSTRIKAILIDENHEVIASGGHDWENKLVNNIWTYDIDEVWTGLQDCYRDLVEDVKKKYDVTLTTFGSIGFSAMMHGYLAFNDKDELLVPFRTWRNTITEPAANALTELFQYNIPQRWSVAHLYQSILNGEEHVSDVRFITTLSGYVHWKLTGEKALGIDDASGMFPIDIATSDFNARMIGQFDELVAEKNFAWKLGDILPKVMVAGEVAGVLTEEGAKLLDPTGNLQAGIPMCPPEGDAGTGMVATNSVKQCTGNVSAGTSIFGMIVLEKELSKVYTELDMVTTPDGSLVAMAHCNNCTSDINAWVKIFKDFADACGMELSMGDLFGTLFNKSLEGDKDCGGVLSYNYYSGEHVTGFEAGRPMVVRHPNSKFNLANFMRANLYTCFGAVKVGMDILTKDEKVKCDVVLGHGGIFKTEGVAQSYLAAAINRPVKVMETAGEGGAWGIALLALFMANKGKGKALPEYLDEEVFGDVKGSTLDPDPADVEGYEVFYDRYTKGLPIERAAVDSLV